MASQEEVKAYLACWFQLGKKLILGNKEEIVFVDSVVKGDRYSAEFEASWQEIIDREGKNCYLEGTEQTIEDLLSSKWNVTACARCKMPIPTLELGLQPLGCPCVDLPSWPDFELPSPRLPVNSNSRMAKIKNRLRLQNTIR